jgi:hypothetical protein
MVAATGALRRRSTISRVVAVLGKEVKLLDNKAHSTRLQSNLLDNKVNLDGSVFY